MVTVPPYRVNSDSSNLKINSNGRSSEQIPPRPSVMALIAVAVGAEHVESYTTRAAATYAFEVKILPNLFFFVYICTL